MTATTPVTSPGQAVWCIPELRSSIISFLSPAEAHLLLFVNYDTFVDAVKVVYHRMHFHRFMSQPSLGTAPAHRLKLYQRAVRIMDGPYNIWRLHPTHTLLSSIVRTSPFIRQINSDYPITITSAPFAPISVEITEHVTYDRGPDEVAQSWQFRIPLHVAPSPIPPKWQVTVRYVFAIDFFEKFNNDFDLEWFNFPRKTQHNVKVVVEVSSVKMIKYSGFDEILEWLEQRAEYFSDTQEISVVCAGYSVEDIARLARLAPKVTTLRLRFFTRWRPGDSHALAPTEPFPTLDMGLLEHLTNLELEVDASTLVLTSAPTLSPPPLSLQTMSILIRPAWKRNTFGSVPEHMPAPIDLAILMVNHGGESCKYELAVLMPKYYEEYDHWTAYCEEVRQGLHYLTGMTKAISVITAV